MLTLVMSSNFIKVNQTNRCKHSECHKQHHRVLPCFKGILSGNRNYLIEKSMVENLLIVDCFQH